MPTSVFGEKLKDQVDDRLHYYNERTHKPMTNTKAMEDALKLFAKELKKQNKAANDGEAAASNGDEKTKKKKRKAEAEAEPAAEEPKKKKKKKKAEEAA
ncbi:nucleolar protein [Diplonema papillatum]|nr:nucleolar protein [Diplonema papillatum]|eukprot:gene9030-13978_t